MTDQYHQFHPFHATRYALDISCFTFLNIVNVSLDVSLTQNAPNDLSIVFFLYFWSVSLFSTACYTSKSKAEISRFVIPEGRMILARFLAANIPNIYSALPVK